MNKRAAIYCRVSTDGQEENSSLDSQEASARQFAEANGYNVTVVYRDVYSGYDLWQRPSLGALRDALYRAEFDAVIAQAVDRLSCKQVHLAILVDECERADVELLFVSEEFEK